MSNCHSTSASSKTQQRDEQAIEHLTLVRAIATRLRATLPAHVELDDLVQAGTIGLLDAISKYDSKKKASFSSYAKFRIKGAMIDSLRQQDWASRDTRQCHRSMDAATHELATLNQRKPTEEEVAEKLGVSMDRFHQMVLNTAVMGVVSSSTYAQAGGEDLPMPQIRDDVSLRPDELCARNELAKAVRAAIGMLPPRMQQVLELYYSYDLRMKDIGKALGVNESRVSQIHKSALEKVAAAFHELGIQSSHSFGMR